MPYVIPNKLMIVRTNSKAQELQKVMGDDWFVTTHHTNLVGRKFNLILLVDQSKRYKDPEEWVEYVNKNLLTRLSHGGNLVEVY